MHLRPLEGSPQPLLGDRNPGEQTQIDVGRPGPRAFDLAVKGGDDAMVDRLPQSHGGVPCPAGNHLAESQ
jgi:hypothetical protein